MLNKVGRKVYYEKSTGNVLLVTSEMMGSVRETTVEEDFQNYSVLAERIPETVGMIRLTYGEYSEDFHVCIGYHVNIETGELEFSYPEPNGGNQEPNEPVYQKPLSEQVKELEEENILLKAQNKALTDKTDFHEDLIAEMAMLVYS